MAQTILDTLAELNTEAWQHLSEAATQADHVMHFLTLTTVNAQGQPQSRLLVLRAADPTKATLEFHTDIRSKKWTELQQNPQLSVLGYMPDEDLQLRLNGHAILHGPDSIHNQQVWQQLSGWTRNNYCGGPPGHELSAPEITGLLDEPPAEADTVVGRQRFGVIQFQAAQLDRFQHPRGALRRALFHYGQDGTLQSANWIRP